MNKVEILGRCISIAALFSRLFLTLKITFHEMLFHKKDPLFSVSGDVNRNSPRKVGMKQRHFAISTSFLEKERSPNQVEGCFRNLGGQPSSVD